MSLVQISPPSTLPSFDPNQGPLATRSKGYYLYVTEACNLRCSYCFVEDKHNHNHLKEDTADAIIEWIINDPEGRSSKYVHFFGGEPLLRPKIIDKIATRLINAATEHKFELSLGITTNGTLLTETNCKMLAHHKIGVQLSLDGSEEGHNVHRQLMGGDQSDRNNGGDAKRSSGAFKLMKIDNYLKYFGSNARMTVTTENVRFLYQSLTELYAIGFKSFSVIPDLSDTWPAEAVAELRSNMDKAFEWWLDMRKEGVQINLFDQNLAKILKPISQNQVMCQAGRTVVGVTIDGDIWPCHDFLGKHRNDPAKRAVLLMGNVREGYNSNVEKFSDYRVYDESGKQLTKSSFDCNKCHAKPICDKGCPYVNYTDTGDTHTVGPNHCIMTKMFADYALRAVSLIKEEFVIYDKTKIMEMNVKIRQLSEIASAGSRDDLTVTQSIS